MKKVVHVVIAGTGEKKPGLGNLVHELAREQASVGVDVSIWRLGDGDHNFSIRTRSFSLHNNCITLPSALKAALKELPDDTIIHAHNGFIPEFYALSREIKKSKKHKLILSSHGSYSDRRIRNLSLPRKIYYYLFERALVKNSAMVHLVGPAEVTGFNIFMENATRFVSLPNGLNDFDRNAVWNRENLPEDNFIMTYAGVLNVFEKGLDILLQSFAAFAKEINSPASLWIIGKGKDEESLTRKVQKLGIQDRVKFHGDLDTHQRRAVFQSTHVFLQTSRVDCIPVLALEAAAHGVPLIVSEETNLGAFVRQYEAGWSLARNNVRTLTGVLHEAYFATLTDESSMMARSHNAYRMIREELNWNSLARKWNEVYSLL